MIQRRNNINRASFSTSVSIILYAYSVGLLFDIIVSNSEHIVNNPSFFLYYLKMTIWQAPLKNLLANESIMHHCCHLRVGRFVHLDQAEP